MKKSKDYNTIIYRNINRILACTVNDDVKLSELNDANTLSKIILKTTFDRGINQNAFNESIGLNTSINISYKFFKSIDEMFANQFLNIIYYEQINNNQAVKFKRIHRIGNIIFDFSGVDYDGNVYIDYDNTIMDIRRLVHEFTHKFSTQYNTESNISKILNETSTIAMEFLLTKYLLINTNYNPDDINSMILARINSVNKDAHSIFFENMILEIYLKNGHINEKVLINYIKQLNINKKLYESIMHDNNDLLRLIVNNNDLVFKKREKYIIGTLLGIYISESINCIPTLKKLINILGNSNLTYNIDVRELNKLNLPCIKNGNLYLSNNNDELDFLTNIYKQKVKKL